MEDLIYNGENMADLNQVFVSYPLGWRKWLIGACEILRDKDSWSGLSDKDEAVAQADKLIALLMGQDPPETTMTNKTTITIGKSAVWNTGVYLTAFASSAYMTGGGLFQTTPLIGDIFCRVNVTLAGGTVEFRAILSHHNNRCKFKFKLVGATTYETTEVDTYAGTDQPNVQVVKTLTDVAPGNYEFQMVVTGKNPLSSNYYLSFQDAHIKSYF